MTDTRTRPAEPAPGPASDRDVTTERTFARIRPFLGPLVLLGLVALFGALYPDTFLTRTNLVDNILGQVAVVAIVAAVQTMVMVVGDFDLSVGGLAALSTVMGTVLIATASVDGAAQTPAPVIVAVLLALAIGALGGALNGILVSYLGVLAFIATLGTSEVFKNLARYRVQGKPVYNLVENNFVEIAQGRVLGVPATVVFAAVIAAIVWFVLDQTPLGRKMYAVGGNPEAARLSGIDTKRIRFVAFTLCGIGVAIAGLLQAAYNQTANTTAPEPWMLKSIAAVFIGMAIFRNGRPNLPGTILGVLLLRVLDNGLNYTDLDDYLQSVISGAAIVIAVLPPAIARLRDSR
jgi:ribose transport system permease protein